MTCWSGLFVPLQICCWRTTDSTELQKYPQLQAKTATIRLTEGTSTSEGILSSVQKIDWNIWFISKFYWNYRNIWTEWTDCRVKTQKHHTESTHRRQPIQIHTTGERRRTQKNIALPQPPSRTSTTCHTLFTYLLSLFIVTYSVNPLGKNKILYRLLSHFHYWSSHLEFLKRRLHETTRY